MLSTTPATLAPNKSHLRRRPSILFMVRGTSLAPWISSGFWHFPRDREPAFGNHINDGLVPGTLVGEPSKNMVFQRPFTSEATTDRLAVCAATVSRADGNHFRGFWV